MRTNLIVLSFFTLIFWLVGWGCKPYNMEEELKKVDSLIGKVKEADNTLVIDIETIKSRYDSMKKIAGYVENHYNQKMSNRLSSTLTRYHAIKSNYANFIENYELLKFENKKHHKRLKNLKKDLIEKNITPKKFDSIYVEEKKIINAHLKRAKDLVGSVTHIEQNYRRAHQEIKKVYNRLKAKEEKTP